MLVARELRNVSLQPSAMIEWEGLNVPYRIETYEKMLLERFYLRLSNIFEVFLTARALKVSREEPGAVKFQYTRVPRYAGKTMGSSWSLWGPSRSQINLFTLLAVNVRLVLLEKDLFFYYVKDGDPFRFLPGSDILELLRKCKCKLSREGLNL